MADGNFPYVVHDELAAQIRTGIKAEQAHRNELAGKADAIDALGDSLELLQGCPCYAVPARVLEILNAARTVAGEVRAMAVAQ